MTVRAASDAEAGIGARFGQRLRLAEPVGGMVLGTVVGAFGGAAAIGFTILIELVQRLVLGAPGAPTDVLGNVAWYWKIAIPAGGGLLVAPMIFRWAAEARGHGVPEVIEAVALRGGVIRPRVAVVKSLASAITIGTGGSVGREGPVVQIGAALGSALGQVTGLPREQRRSLVGCGAAAGIAATFNAPIAAAFFALEVILGNFAVATFGPIVLASVVATAVSRAYFGNAPAFTIPEYELVSWWELTSYVGLGLLCGVVACAFIWVLSRLEDLFEASPLPQLLHPAVGGALLGGMLLALPELYGSGFQVIEGVLHGREPWIVALALVIAKVAAASVTLASGGSGGVFSPSLFIGAVAGYTAGHWVGVAAPFPTAPPGAYALVGMGALLAAATHAPITSMLMLFELSGDYNIILPMMLAITVSTSTARAVLRNSIYSEKLERKGIRLVAGREETVMTRFRVKEVMEPDPPSVSTETPLREVVAKFLSAPITELYVVDGERRLVGTISLHDIKGELSERTLDRLVVAHDMMARSVPAALADDTLADSMRRFAEASTDSLPVVSDRQTKRLIGIITQQDLVEVYDQEVLRREILGTSSPGDARTRPFALPAGHRLRSLRVPASWVGSTLRALDLRRRTDVTVIGIQHADERVTADTADPERPLAAGDVLVLLGGIAAFGRLDALVAEAEREAAVGPQDRR